MKGSTQFPRHSRDPEADASGCDARAECRASGAPVHCIPRWAERYLSIRFMRAGRKYPDLDCWGLVRLVLFEQAGVHVPAYGDVAAGELLRIARMIESASSVPPWIEVKTSKAFDVVKMRGENGRAETHVGIMVNNTHMLHVEEASDAAIVPLDHLSVSSRVIGFYRHEALA